MKTARAKLSTLAAAAVIATLVAASVVFNLFIGWKIETDAVNDIEYALGLNDEAVDAGRTPNYVVLDSSFQIQASERPWGTGEETLLAAWFAEHPDAGAVNRIVLDGWTYYAAVLPIDFSREFGYDPYDDPYGDAYGYHDTPWEQQSPSGGMHESGYYLAYIDTASEQSLISAVNTAFAIIGIVGALIAAIAGYVAGRRIDEANDAQKRFYENMSHDLKTPLAAIRGYAEGADDGVVDVHEATRAITRETDRMTDTINEILSLSRLESGAVQPVKEAVEVADFAQDCLMPLEGAVRAKGIDVELELAAGEIQADPALFDHALSNVLANAVRHASSRMRVSYDGRRLAVFNDGDVPGPEVLPHLFDRFHAGEGGSTGIGLAIAKEVAGLHGWTVSAHAVDDGLEVAFTF